MIVALYIVVPAWAAALVAWVAFDAILVAWAHSRGQQKLDGRED